ncbi:TAFII55 protein conserved region-domain-containing protein [Entophlyctis helioformis]|nr:TAFII55 protein conserved region-domain-containing protein [Entophlyctis helioformis]
MGMGMGMGGRGRGRGQQPGRGRGRGRGRGTRKPNNSINSIYTGTNMPSSRVLAMADSSRDYDEALAEAPVEEHLILRLPPAMADGLRERIKRRDVPQDLLLSFDDARHGLLKHGSATHKTRLVDLPCIVESLKTIDNKQFYKVANIAQMIVVEPTPLPAGTTTTTGAGAAGVGTGKSAKEVQWPDGLTPPLKNVRTRRFRKRISKKLIEDVEQEVERLLLADAESDDVRYELHDRREHEGSMYGDDGHGGHGGMGGMAGSDGGSMMDGDGGSMMDGDGGGMDGDMDLDGEDELAAEIQDALDAEEDGDDDDGGGGVSGSGGGGGVGSGSGGAGQAKDSDDDDDEDEDEEEEEDEGPPEGQVDADGDDDDDDGGGGGGGGGRGGNGEGDGGDTARALAHLRKQAGVVQAEITDLERKVSEKSGQAQAQVNPIMRKRFQGIVETLRKELDIKTMQLADLHRQIEEAGGSGGGGSGGGGGDGAGGAGGGGDGEDGADPMLDEIDQMLDTMDQMEAEGDGQ